MVCSTGIGGPSTAIAVEELAALGVHTFIRIGTCGAMQEEILGGDVVIATAAVRQDGTTREYAPLEFPAAANFDAVAALRESATVSYTHLDVYKRQASFLPLRV